MKMTKILIVDDNAGFRRRIAEFLAPEQDILVIGYAADGRQAVDMAIELEPDLVLMDVRMAGMNGLSATQHIKDVLPEMCIIILSRYDLQEYQDAARAAGADAYVVKQSLLDDLLPAIRRAAQSKACDAA